LLLIGDGPERERLFKLSETRGIPNRVHLVGQQGNVGQWLAISDIYVNSSISEGMSMSVLEAMAAGLPCVVTDVGFSASLIGRDRTCGLVVPPGKVSEMASAIERLASSADLRQRMSAAAQRRHAEHYSTRSMIRGYQEVYRELIGRTLVSERRRP